MPDLHTEIEYKFDAKKVDSQKFIKWAMDRRPVSYESGSCPDVYYVRGKDSIRHRWSGGTAGELTVKRRTSSKNLMNREEIDLFFDTTKTQIADINAFLIATGWARLFTLFKGGVHVFAFDLPLGGKIYMSLYEVEKFNEKTRKYTNKRQFLEIEVEKGSSYNEVESKAILDTWKNDLQLAFGLGNPLNESLFEIYSGKSTQTKSSAT